MSEIKIADATSPSDAIISVFNPSNPPYPHEAPEIITDEYLASFCVLSIWNGRGLWVIRVYGDGRMEFNPDFEPSEQARAFREAINLLTIRGAAGVGQSPFAVFPLATPKEK